MGMLNDAKLSLFRLYLNYHDDPVKQDALYLLMNGRYPPPPQSPVPSSLSIQSTIAASARAFRCIPSTCPELFLPLISQGRPVNPPTSLFGQLYCIGWALTWMFVWKLLSFVGFKPASLIPRPLDPEVCSRSQKDNE